MLEAFMGDVAKYGKRSPTDCVRFAVKLAVAVAALGLTAVPAFAQQLTVRVLIDDSYAVQSERFLDEMAKSLEPEARSVVKFEARAVTPTRIDSALRQDDWEMAIVSTSALIVTKVRSSIAAFDMPYVFPSSESAIALQRSPTGRAALSTISRQGMTGLVYLNAGGEAATHSRRPAGS